MKYDSVENAPTIPASSAGRGQLLGKEKTVSLPGYILAQTNNVLLEATNLYKPTNREEEGGEAICESEPGSEGLPRPLPTSPGGNSNSAEKYRRHKWFHKAHRVSPPFSQSMKTERMKDTAFL